MKGPALLVGLMVGGWRGEMVGREGLDLVSELACVHPFGPRGVGPHDGESGPGLLSQVSEPSHGFDAAFL